MSSFREYTLLPSLLSTLQKLDFNTPTEIQAKALPALLRGESVVGVAETGSGKTLAYALPALHKVKQLEDEGDAISEPGRPRAIVLVPSSGLGEQVTKVFKDFTHETRVRVRSALGGIKMAVARRNVSGPCEILLATPGRLEQLMQLKLINLSDLRLLVLDEADQMLDAGFRPAIQRFLKSSPADLQLALFTATASEQVQALIQELFSEATHIETAGHHRLVSSLKTVNFPVLGGNRFAVLEEILEEQVDGGTLLFTNTREQCDALAEELKENGYDCAVYRGDMDKLERRQNLQAFRDGDIELLISTDLAARGLDVDNIDRVINYHLPKELKNYLHRAGRTARAGQEGTVINLVTNRNKNLVKRISERGSTI